MSAIYDREKSAGRQLKWAAARLLVRDSTSGNYCVECKWTVQKDMRY